MKCTIVKDLLSICNKNDVIDAIIAKEDITGDVGLARSAYSYFIDNLKLRVPIKTNYVILGIELLQEGVKTIEASLFNVEELKSEFNDIPEYESISNVDDLSIEAISDLIGNFHVPKSYAYEFTEWDKILGFRLDQINVELIDRCQLLADILSEMTFFGLDEGERVKHKEELDNVVSDIKAIIGKAEANFSSPIDIIEKEFNFEPYTDEEYLNINKELLHNKIQSYYAIKKFLIREKNTHHETKAMGYIRFIDKETARNSDEYKFIEEAISNKGYKHVGTYSDITCESSEHGSELIYILTHLSYHDFDVLFVNGLDNLSQDKKFLKMFCKHLLAHDRHLFDIKTGKEIDLPSVADISSLTD